MLKRIGLILALVFIWLTASRALLSPEMFRIHDYVHGARIGEMTRALQDGHFPVRWSRNFGFGYGMPLFEFYAPLPYYVGSIFYWLSGDIVLAVKLLFGVCSLLTMIGAYFLGRDLFGRTGGLVTAAALTLAPYRAVNLYVRGALSEAWGIMALPWILWGGILVIQRKKYGWLVLVLGLVTLFLSHNLTSLLFIPLSLVFLAGYWFVTNFKNGQKKMAWQAGLQIIGAYGLAGGLASFYLVPAFGEKDFTQIDTIIGGYFDYRLHFLYLRQLITPYWGYGGSTWGPDDGISFFLGWGQWLGLGVTVLLLFRWLWLRWRQRPTRKHVKDFKPAWWFIGLGGLLAISLGMTLGRSQPLWDSLPFLAYVQFPWRWLGPAILFLSLLVGLGGSLLKRAMTRYLWAGTLTLILILGSWSYFQPEEFLETADAFYYTDPTRIQQDMSGVLQDYFPIQMSGDLKYEPVAQPDPIITEVSEVELTTLVDRTHEKLFQVRFDQPTELVFAIADFPGWFVQLDGSPWEKQQSPVGSIQVTIPGDGQEHLLGIRWGATPLRWWADLVSGMSVLILIACLIDRQSLSKHWRESQVKV